MLCKYCEKRAVPPAALRKRHYKCTFCRRQMSKKRRHFRWDGGERPLCRNHPLTIVNLGMWINDGRNLCSHCRKHKTAASLALVNKCSRSTWHRNKHNPEWREHKRFISIRTKRKQKLLENA